MAKSTKLADQPPMDFVLINRSRNGGKYHRPVQLTWGVSTGCGSNTRDMIRTAEKVAASRYGASRCGRCWR